MDLDKVGIFATSFGAAVASELCRTNPRFKAAAFLDGYFAPAPLALSSGLPQPSVTVTGTPPFGFSWHKVSAVLTNIVQNETTSTFTLLNVRTNDAGNYFVVVTNAFKMTPGVASPPMPLTVTAP